MKDYSLLSCVYSVYGHCKQYWLNGRIQTTDGVNFGPHQQQICHLTWPCHFELS